MIYLVKQGIPYDIVFGKEKNLKGKKYICGGLDEDEIRAYCIVCGEIEDNSEFNYNTFEFKKKDEA